MRPQGVNPYALAQLFEREFRLCNVKTDETLVVLSDHDTRRDFVLASFAAAGELGANIYEMSVSQVPNWATVGKPTVGACKGAVEALKAADMLICLHIPLFTKWLKEVRAAGTRVLMIIDHPDDLQACLGSDEFHHQIKAAVTYSGERLKNTKTMRLVSAAGTDLSVTVGDFPVMMQYGFADLPGRFDHWGAGMVHTFPTEGSANGTVVLAPGDLCVLPYNRYIENPVRFTIRDGFVTDIEGGTDARLMKYWLDSNSKGPDDRDGYAISHLGWGVNPKGRWDNIALYGNDPDRSMGSARAFAGNFLFSTGPNTEGGGTRATLAHLDIPMRDCTVLLDNDKIIERGKILDPQMIVRAA